MRIGFLAKLPFEYPICLVIRYKLHAYTKVEQAKVKQFKQNFKLHTQTLAQILQANLTETPYQHTQVIPKFSLKSMHLYILD